MGDSIKELGGGKEIQEFQWLLVNAGKEFLHIVAVCGINEWGGYFDGQPQTVPRQIELSKRYHFLHEILSRNNTMSFIEQQLP
jgi:hypothetical protein